MTSHTSNQNTSPRVGRTGFLIIVMIAFVLAGGVHFPVGARAAELPAGVPDGAERATVTGLVDGDTIKVNLNRAGQEVTLAAIDAPQHDECFGPQATDRLGDLLPKNTKVSLESSGEDEDDRLLRFIWLPGADGDKATLLTTKLVREGYAGFADDTETERYLSNLEAAEVSAQEKGAGVWGACGELHAPPPTTPAEEALAEEAFTVEETVYLFSAITPIVDAWNAVYDIGMLLNENARGTEWVTAVAFDVVVIQDAYLALQAINPPAAMGGIHALYLEGLASADAASRELTYALDQSDPAALERAGAGIDQA